MALVVVIMDNGSDNGGSDIEMMVVTWKEVMCLVDKRWHVVGGWK